MEKKLCEMRSLRPDEREEKIFYMKKVGDLQKKLKELQETEEGGKSFTIIT